MSNLVKVVFVGSSSPQDQTGIIKLANGQSGEPRELKLGGDVNDALVTEDELHMLTSKFQIEVVEDQPELDQDEIDAQTPPSDVSSPTGVPATLPVSEDGEQVSADQPGDQPPAPISSEPTPSSPPAPDSEGDQPIDPVQTTSQPAPASPEPTSPTPVQ